MPDGQPQTNRPPLALWTQLSLEQQQLTDLILAQHARGAGVGSVESKQNQPASTGTVQSDAMPEPMQEGQQYAQVERSEREGRNGGPRRPLGAEGSGQIAELRIANYNRIVEAIRRLEPSNRYASYIADPTWEPKEEDFVRIEEELSRVQQRAAGGPPADPRLGGKGPVGLGGVPQQDPVTRFNAVAEALRRIDPTTEVRPYPLASGRAPSEREIAEVEKTLAEAIKSARPQPETTNKGSAVLGHHPADVDKANSIGAQYFNVPREVWARMTPAEQWSANARFLDRVAKRKHDIVLATPIEQARPGSFFAREIEYLIGRGYTPSADGTRLLPPANPQRTDP